MQIVPLQPVPSQTVKVILNNQVCQINVYQKFFGLYVDILVNNSLIIGGVVCENLNRIVRSKYLGFIGDFTFFDTQGTDDPDYTGLGDQFVFCYIDPTDPLQAVPD
jgi:hypothetical protein